MHFDLWPSTLDPSNLFLGDNGGTEMLFNVMKAYAVCDPEVGYCQGSAFLAGMLLLHMPEEDAFSVFMKLMSKGSGKIYLKSTTRVSAKLKIRSIFRPDAARRLVFLAQF